MIEDLKNVMSQKRAVQEFRVSRSKLYNLIKADVLPLYSIDGVLYLNVSDYGLVEKLLYSDQSHSKHVYIPKKLPEDEMTRKMREHDEKYSRK